MAIGGEYMAVWDGSRWVSVRGDKGEPGTSLTVKGMKPTVADLPASGAVGEAWIVAGAMWQWDGTTWNNLGNVTGPKGDPGLPGAPGPAGPKGDRGTDGTSATVRVGTVTSGTTPAVTNTGTNSAAVLNFTLAQGATGPAGPKGEPGTTPSISVAATTTLPSGSPATVSATSAGALTFGIPKGDAGAAGAAGATGPAGKDGTNGKDGAAATITMGTVTTLAAGQPATAKNTGTSAAAVIELSIPQGTQGTQGAAGKDGAAATITIGTTTAGTTPSVTNSGTTAAAVLDFVLVKGDKGDAGAAGKDGSGVTITGTQNGGTWPPTGTHTKGDMLLLGTPLPTGVPAGSKTGDGMVYDGAAWTNVGSIQGPAGPAGATGPAGPTAVSTDAGNYSKLGTDSKLFTPTPVIPAAATANPLADAATAVLGTSAKYAREDHVHPLPTLTALGAAATKHTHAAATDITGLATVATSGKYTDLTDTPAAYTLPTASATVLGGAKIGTGLTMTGDVLSANATKVDPATTTTAGTVTLADATAITNGTAGKIPDAAQLKGQVDPKAPKANPTFTGVVSIPGGTAAAPAVSFTGDADTGVYEPAGNQFGIAAGGVGVLTVAPTGATVTGTLTAGGLTYPTAKGTTGQVLTSDGAGNVSWSTVTSGGSSYVLPTATPLILGGVKVADAAAVTLGAAGYVVDAAQLKAAAYTLPDATTAAKGGVQLADAAAVTAGTAGRVVDAAQLKAVADTHVKLAGDHMTGILTIQPTTSMGTVGGVNVIGTGAGGAAALTAFTYSDSAGTGAVVRLRRWRGTKDAPTGVQKGDVLGTFSFNGAKADGNSAGGGNFNVVCTATPLAGETTVGCEMAYIIQNGGATPGTTSFTVGQNRAVFTNTTSTLQFGINTTTPEKTLDVNGATILRGTLDVAGNITSTGTAHSFVAKSIPASAIGAFLGRTEFSANNEDFSIGLRHVTGGAMTYLGTTAAGVFVVSTVGGSPVFKVDGTGNITTPGGGNFSGVLAVNTLTPSTDAAKARVVVVGDSLSAANLAESNTKAAVSIRPNAASGYTLAVGSMAVTNYPYIQGVTINGGGASSAVCLQPYGGDVAIGKTATPTATLDVVGTVAITGNITCTGTAHSFANNSIPAAAISGLPIKTQVLTQAAYDALATKDATTLYLISG